MSGTRELRERLEALQSGIKEAKEALASPPPPELVAELETLTADAETAEQDAADLEMELLANRESCAALRGEVERAEQSVLGPQATSSVPLLSVLFTFSFLPVAVIASVMLNLRPRMALMMLAVKAVALAGPLVLAWVAKRRLLSPARVLAPPQRNVELRSFQQKDRR